MSVVGRHLPPRVTPALRGLPPITRSRPRALPVANATIAAREDVTATLAVFVVVLDRPLLTYRPGQYVSLGISDAGELIQRPYSVVSLSTAGTRLELFVRRLPDGRFSNLLWRQEVGQRISVGQAKGLFMLDEEDRRPRIFVGTGTGVAPLLAMIESASESHDPTPSVFIHGASFADELHFGDRVEEWQKRRVGLDYRPTVSRSGDERNFGWTGRSGRAQAQLAALLDEWPWLRAGGGVAYMCGNPDVVAACADVLRDASFAATDIHVELFHAPAPRAM